MAVKKYALLGRNLSHTISPFIHERLFKLATVRAEYGVVDLAGACLYDCKDILKSLSGYNVTIPFKRDIIQLIDKIDYRASACGAVNTVVNNNRSIGYNTDITGFLGALKLNGIEPSGRAVVLGAGGASAAITLALAKKGCHVDVCAREKSLDKAHELARYINKEAGIGLVSAINYGELCGRIDLLVNATPVGMYPNTNELPVSEEIIRDSGIVFDAVYNPVSTLFTRTAEKYKIMAVGGLDMLVLQAVDAHKIWHGKDFSEGDIMDLIEKCKDLLEQWGDR